MKPFHTVIASMAAIQVKGEAYSLPTKGGRKALQLLGQRDESFLLLFLLGSSLASTFAAFATINTEIAR